MSILRKLGKMTSFDETQSEARRKSEFQVKLMERDPSQPKVVLIAAKNSRHCENSFSCKYLKNCFYDWGKSAILSQLCSNSAFCVTRAQKKRDVTEMFHFQTNPKSL